MSEPLWIGVRDVLLLHARLAAIEGTATGLRDEGLLASALARPRQLHSYGERAGIIEMAAAYTVGIVRSHPFVDGNKRTGFVVGVLFLELNGFRFKAAEEDAANVMMSLAAGTIDEAGFAAWLMANTASSAP